MSIFSHRHKHEAITVQKRTPAPFGPSLTIILWRCPCGDVTTQEIAGVWTLDQVRDVRYLIATERVGVDLEVERHRTTAKT